MLETIKFKESVKAILIKNISYMIGNGRKLKNTDAIVRFT